LNRTAVAFAAWISVAVATVGCAVAWGQSGRTAVVIIGIWLSIMACATSVSGSNDAKKGQDG
jgi:hypothetical protein